VSLFRRVLKGTQRFFFFPEYNPHGGVSIEPEFDTTFPFSPPHLSLVLSITERSFHARRVAFSVYQVDPASSGVYSSCKQVRYDNRIRNTVFLYSLLTTIPPPFCPPPSPGPFLLVFFRWTSFLQSRTLHGLSPPFLYRDCGPAQ